MINGQNSLPGIAVGVFGSGTSITGVSVNSDTPFIPALPNLGIDDPLQTLRDAVAIRKQIETIKKSISNGMTAKDASRILRGIANTAKNQYGVDSTVYTGVLKYVDEILFTISLGRS